MHVTRYKRQVFLFLAAILVPAAVLVGLASRILYQDRELAAKRAADQRHIALDQLRRELDAHLEAIKLQEINRLIRSLSLNRSQNSDNPAVVFTASVQGDSLVFPWDGWQAAAAKDSAAFATHRQEGEAQEFVKKDYAAAAAAYDLALASSVNPKESAEARLSLARALAKAGKPEEASRLYRTLLNAPPDARDEQGVGYRFYAADRLLAAGRDPASVLSFLRQEINGVGQLTLPELYMIRPLVGAGPKISQRIAEMEQVAALAKDFGRVRARIESGGGPAWVPYGDEPWLVTLTAAQPPLPGLVLAVSSTKVAPPGVQLRTRASAGDALGDEFRVCMWNGPIPGSSKRSSPVCRSAFGSRGWRWCWASPCLEATCSCAMSTAIFALTRCARSSWPASRTS
jgi:tetratricopeptide (TPR) repeat protein